MGGCNGFVSAVSLPTENLFSAVGSDARGQEGSTLLTSHHSNLWLKFRGRAPHRKAGTTRSSSVAKARRRTDAAAALRRPPPEECQTWSSCLGTNRRPTILRRTEFPHASAPISTTMPLPNPRPRYPTESLAHACRAPTDPTPVISHL